MDRYWNTHSLEELIYLIDEAYPSGAFRYAYQDIRADAHNTCNSAPMEEDVAHCLIRVMLQNYSTSSSPVQNLRRILGEVERYAHLVEEVRVQLADLHARAQDAPPSAEPLN